MLHYALAIGVVLSASIVRFVDSILHRELLLSPVLLVSLILGIVLEESVDVVTLLLPLVDHALVDVDGGTGVGHAVVYVIDAHVVQLL